MQDPWIDLPSSGPQVQVLGVGRACHIRAGGPVVMIIPPRLSFNQLSSFHDSNIHGAGSMTF